MLDPKTNKLIKLLNEDILLLDKDKEACFVYMPEKITDIVFLKKPSGSWKRYSTKNYIVFFDELTLMDCDLSREETFTIYTKRIIEN